MKNGQAINQLQDEREEALAREECGSNNLQVLPAGGRLALTSLGQKVKQFSAARDSTNN
jgi:hypothetical protein